MNYQTNFLRNFEQMLGFKSEIRWNLTLRIIFIHIFGAWWCWNYAFPVKFLTVLFAIFMFVIGGMGITVGAHRLFSHCSFKVNTFCKIYLLLCYTSSGQNSIYYWIRDHRQHHKFSDSDADPHNSTRGLFFSHIGWLMMKRNEEVKKESKKINMSDIKSDKYIMFFHRHFHIIMYMCCYILPTLTGIILWGENWKSAIAWQCFIRFLVLLHCELCINSIGHAYGYAPYNKHILPKQNLFLAFITFGEGWHNYHHAFPYDYKAAEFCDSLNFSTYIIKWLQKNGWAYDLKEASTEVVKDIIDKFGDGTQRIHPQRIHSGYQYIRNQ